MLVSLIQPSAGEIRIDGHSLARASGEAGGLARVGAVIEEPRFHPHLTGRENLQVVAAARGPQARRRVEPAPGTAWGSATEAATGWAATLRACASGSASPRCLLADPQLVILDEPMNGLDPGGILGHARLIAALVAEGRTVFVSSHLLDEIEKTCFAVAGHRPGT